MVKPLSERDWKVRLSTVRYGQSEYRVVRPERLPRFARLYEGRLGAQLCLGKEMAAQLALAWGFAARSPYTIVYLPLRAESAKHDCGWGRPLDLVLLHHRLGMPASRWKHLRSRLGPGRPHTFQLMRRSWPRRPVEDHRRSRHQGFRDFIRWRIAADTLVLTGSKEAFELEADQVRGLAEDCPAHLSGNPGTHCCAEISMGRGRFTPDRRNPYAELHAEYCQAGLRRGSTG